MNKRLNEAITRVSKLPDEQQEAAAVVLLDFLDHGDVDLTPEQIAELERRLEEDDIATDEEVGAFFKRLKK